MTEVINSGTGIEIRKGTLRGAGHVLYFNQGGYYNKAIHLPKLKLYIFKWVYSIVCKSYFKKVTL